MLRKLVFVVCAVALTLASCGRQVTPNRTTSPSGLSPAQIQIKFTTQGPADFVNNYYVLAFNTSGTGTEPYALNGNSAQNWLDFSYEIVVFQPNASSAIQATLWQFVSTQSTNGGFVKTPVRVNVINPQDLFITPSCGSSNTFCVTFNRIILITAFTSPTPSPTPTTTASASPTASPSVSPSPTSTPPGSISNVWFINWFVASPAGVPAGQVSYAPGLGGINDHTFTFQVDTATTFDRQWATQAGWPQAPAAQYITGGEVLNSP